MPRWDSIGFLTHQHHFQGSSEITWMAVHGDHRRQGIGHALTDRVCDLLRTEGRRFLLVLTVSPTDDSDAEPPDGYQATRAF